MRKLDTAALILVIVGALNWGLVALAEFDLVAKIFGMEFGQTDAASRVVYGLVGLSGMWIAVRATTLLGPAGRARTRARVMDNGREQHEANDHRPERSSRAAWPSWERRPPHQGPTSRLRAAPPSDS